MQDLLWDNSLVRCHYRSIQGDWGFTSCQRPSSLKFGKSHLSLHGSAASWSTWQCPDFWPSTWEKAKNNLLVVRKAMQHGGQGWIEYYHLHVFRLPINQEHKVNLLAGSMIYAKSKGGINRAFNLGPLVKCDSSWPAGYYNVISTGTGKGIVLFCVRNGIMEPTIAPWPSFSSHQPGTLVLHLISQASVSVE